NTDATTIGILAEPAPYLLPPINLSHWRVLLFPDNTINEQQELPDILIHTRGTPDFRMGVQPSPYYVWPSYIRVFDSTAISWANKRFGFWLRKDLQNSTSQEANINAP
ncbi:MAG: hypothetical protein JSV03_13390, partial [Planctomycetota bacterium]